MIERDWFGCYGKGWTDITPESYSHPAKYSAGLIKRIYAHCLEQGYLQFGDTVLDPFGGVALGGHDAIHLGLNWIGVELEQRFNDMGAGCECTGISKADWVRFYGRWDRGRYLDGRHWCPRCLAEAKRIDPPDDGQLSFLPRSQSAVYVRNSGRIPCTTFHHYTGNIELWSNGHGVVVQLIQGDSRYLSRVLGQAGGVVSSPPYAESHTGAEDNPYVNVPSGQLGDARTGHLAGKKSGNYGHTPGQLGAMRVVSSPPYAENVHDGNGIDPDKLTGNPAGRNSQGFAEGYGSTSGQLGAMRVVSSPPYAESLSSDDPDKRKGLFRDPKRCNDRTLTAEYGESEGQLGRMRVVSSPPWERQNACNDPDYQTGRTNRGGPLYGDYGSSDAHPRVPPVYTRGDGQETGTDFWSAACQIMHQVYAILLPGAVTVWVLKAFVRDKQIVDFPDQWRRLGEACGFETVEWIRAWLIEDRGAQYTLEGELEQKQVKRCSFFRRLAESKGSPPIDYEVVLVQRRADV